MSLEIKLLNNEEIDISDLIKIAILYYQKESRAFPENIFKDKLSNTL